MKKLTAVLFVVFMVLVLIVACSPPSTGSGGSTGGGGQSVTVFPTRTRLPEKTLKPGAGGIPMQPGGSDETEEVRGGPDLALSSFEMSMEGFEGSGCVDSLDHAIETTICIANEGNRDSDAFSVSLGTTTHEFEGLASGDEECFVTDAVGGDLEIDPDDAIEETDEENNTETLPVPTPPAVCTPES
jgi:hypothetical protein